MQDAISYKRFSSPRQRRGDSERRQADLTEEYCKHHGLRLIDSYLDAGRSGFIGEHLTDRGALRALLKAAKAGKFKPGTHLIVEALDRLSRQEISTALRLFLDILDTGLVVVTLIDGEQVFTRERIDADLTAIIIAIVCLSRGNNEARVRRERALHAQHMARQKAREQGTPITAECPRWLALLGKGDGRHFVVDQGRARLIRHIFSLAASGMGQLRLARYLNGHGVPTFGSARLWRPGMIAHLLQNRAVLGIYQPHLSFVENGRRRRKPDPDGPIEGYFPAIVGRRLFNKVQLATRDRRKHYGQRVVPARSNLLTRLGSCAQCDGPLYLSQTKDGFAYLRCTNVRERVCSNNLGFPYRKLETVLLALDRITELVGRLVTKALGEGADCFAVDAGEKQQQLEDDEAFLSRFRTAKVGLGSADIHRRHLARGALVEEFRELFEGVVLHPNRLVSLHARPNAHGDHVILLSYDGLRIQIRSPAGVIGLIERTVLTPLVGNTSSGIRTREPPWEPREIGWLLERTHIIAAPNGDWQAVLGDPMQVADVVIRAENALLGDAGHRRVEKRV